MLKSIFTTSLAGIVAFHVAAAIADPVSDRITVTVRGQGPDVVLIPGLASSGAVWDATVSHLEGHYRLHIVQIAGFAGAPARANARGPVIQPTLEALDAYIKTNKLKSPKIIGHSLGGLMGMMLVLEHPEDGGKLMIVDSLPFFSALFGANDAARQRRKPLQCVTVPSTKRRTPTHRAKENSSVLWSNRRKVSRRQPNGRSRLTNQSWLVPCSRT
jgi:pimeloyl-ACP methyl ester carboxylesterase